MTRREMIAAMREKQKMAEWKKERWNTIKLPLCKNINNVTLFIIIIGLSEWELHYETANFKLVSRL